MTLPTITRAQLEPLLERLLGNVNEPAPLVFVRGDASASPPTASVRGRPVDVMASSSPLDIRAQASKKRDRPLVVVTGCDTSTLGDDLLARGVRRKIHSVDRWHTVAQLFGAEQPTRSLAEHAALADALIDAKPVNGYPKGTTQVLDLDTALEALTHAHLGLRPESLGQLLAWGEAPAAARIVRTTSLPVMQQLEAHLARQLGPGVAMVFAAIRADLGAEVMQYALAADVIHRADAGLPDAAVHLDYALGKPNLRPDAHRDIGRAAVERVIATPADQAPVGFWLSGAEALLATWHAAHAAVRSPVLISGFNMRVSIAADVLRQWHTDVTSAELEEAAEAAIESVAQHHQQHYQPQRLERLRMASRLIRRNSVDLGPAGTLREQLNGYTVDGAWLDRARIVVSQGDADPAMAQLCNELTVWADAGRLAQGESLARITASAASQLGDGLLGVEEVLGKVVTPLAGTRPVLMVVLDGMSWPIFTDLIGRLRQQGWGQYVDADGVTGRPVVAALPTVTELSRTSLLSGILRSGSSESERRAFTAHEGLVSAGTKAYPPQLFHKSDFRKGGLDTIPHNVLEVIHNAKNTVVGIVLNNIDERLKDVANPPRGWGLDELAPLRETLDAARQAGRAVVLTSDHGHVLERQTQKRSGGGEGGERWRRISSGPVGEGELKVAGPRVVNEEHAAILPWAEKIQYGLTRNGYHGGLALAELAVPLAVLAADEIDGWVAVDTAPPEWWHPALPTVQVSPIDLVAPSSPKVARPTVIHTPSLFDPEPMVKPDPVPASTSVARAITSGPIAQIVATDFVQGQLASLRLDETLVLSILNLLNAVGGTYVYEDRIAEHAGVPQMRISRVITQLQRLLNIDGYAVIETSHGQVRFDRQLLERQLGL